MKAVYVGEFGPAEAMRVVELPDPVAGPGQVRVRVRASGLNFAETRMRAGTYGGQPADFVLGMESAGEVEAVGDGVTGFAPGDRVFGRARGSHAEKVLFDADHLMQLPDNLTFEQGAAIPVGWLTAWHALITVGNVQPDDRLLIEGVGSSVGSAALQIATWVGCWVAGTASRPSKVRAAIDRGADAGYVYTEENVADRVKVDTNGEGASIALMIIGGDHAQWTLDSMGMDGRVVIFGSTGGIVIPLNLAIGSRNLSLLSMSISTAPSFLTRTMPDFKARAIPLFANGTFTAEVSTVLPSLDAVVEGHHMISDRNHYGKVIITVP